MTALVVDLDGTLIRSDLLIESGFALAGCRMSAFLAQVPALLDGKAKFKARIAGEVEIDVASLPYDPAVLALIREAKDLGRKVYLASASNQRYVGAICDHLGLFDGWFASDETVNLTGMRKAERLVAEFGAGGFDYVGNSDADLAVWARAHHAIAVGAGEKLRRKVLDLDPEARFIGTPGRSPKLWLKLLRVHQWSKNILVMVPFLTAHQFTLAALSHAILAFVAFSLTASAVYIINDLVDLSSDRGHPTKHRRPLAAGTLPIFAALLLSPIMLVVAFTVAALITPAFLATLFGYFVLTTAYSFHLKRKMMADVVTLAALYTARVIGGAAAIPVELSPWLLAFSMFFFTSLALVKRYVELADRLDRDLPDPSGRDYRKADLDIIATLTAAAGFNAVTVFALYVSSDTVRVLYHHPQILWLVCPVLMYWLGRALMLAHRRLMHDDPVIFALRDRLSLMSFAIIVLIMVAAL